MNGPLGPENFRHLHPNPSESAACLQVREGAPQHAKTTPVPLLLAAGAAEPAECPKELTEFLPLSAKLPSTGPIKHRTHPQDLEPRPGILDTGHTTHDSEPPSSAPVRFPHFNSSFHSSSLGSYRLFRLFPPSRPRQVAKSSLGREWTSTAQCAAS